MITLLLLIQLTQSQCTYKCLAYYYIPGTRIHKLRPAQRQRRWYKQHGLIPRITRLC